MKHIFVSHAGADSKIADKLFKDLKNVGHDVQIDLHELKLGDDTIEFMDEAIANAHTVIIVFSKDTPAAKWQKLEIHAAVWNETAQSGGKVIVLKVGKVDLPPLLGSKMYGSLDDDQYKNGFGPFTPGFTLLPYGDLDAVKQAMNPNVVGVLIEPIQGESGIIVPPEGYLAGIAELCREHRALLICDEIQSGLGRTGKLFAFEHEGVRPDIVIIGKALAGGFYPVSAILADDEVMNVFNPGDHGSTFGGNPLGCAVAHEALRVLIDEGMIENSATLGAYFLERLQAIESPQIKEVRGKGLWIGVQLTPQAGGARRFCEALEKKGLLCKETHVDTIRFAPPLCITQEELNWALERIVAVFAEIDRRYSDES